MVNILLISQLVFCKTEWLIKTSSKSDINFFKDCHTILLNPNLGSDIFKLKCDNALAMIKISPLRNLLFEKELSWQVFSMNDLSRKEINDPLAIDQWSLEQLAVKWFWDTQSNENSRVKVAIIDTGIDYNHEDLLVNIEINKNEIPDNQVDDDKNGYVDDVYGWNSSENTNDPFDMYTHGTHVSGIIGATSTNEIGITGLNRNVGIIPIRFVGLNGGGSTESAIRAFDYAVIRGAKVINLSWGGANDSPILKEIINRCREKGILIVAAAGNESTDNDKVPTYPASFNLDNIISVAAINLRGELSSFSNWGKRAVHVAAPGESILSTIKGNKYGFSDGTSMATPHISAIATLLWSKNENWNYIQVRDNILKNCSVTQSLKDKIACNGYFRFNVKTSSLVTK